MTIKTNDGVHDDVASQGLATTGVVLGGIGTLLGLGRGGRGRGFDLFGGGDDGGGRTRDFELRQTDRIAELAAAYAGQSAERYAEQQTFAAYKDITNKIERENDRRDAMFAKAETRLLVVERDLALNQARLEGLVQGNKDAIAAVREETRLAIALEGERRVADVQRVFEYGQAHYVKGRLRMPIDEICPQPMPLVNTWVAPTATAPTNVDVVNLNQ